MTHPVAWTAEDFEARLRAKQAGYHIHHPFNLRMRAGECTPEEIRTWVANRFYYQVNIPLKDAAILSNCPDRAQRGASGSSAFMITTVTRHALAASKAGCGWAKPWG